MNTAMFLVSACLVGTHPTPVVATSHCTGGCATATSVSVGDCDPCANGHKLGLLEKLKAKLCNPCATHDAPVCEKPKPVCIKHEPICKVEKCDPCAKVCWKPGMLLHKIKDKIAHLCHKDDGTVEVTSVCTGGCGTAATPGGCGSTVIPPTVPSTTPPAVIVPGTPMTIPSMTTPKVEPKTVPMVEPKAQPKTTPKTVIYPTPYNPNLSAVPTSKPALAPVIVPTPPTSVVPRTLDLGPAPF